MQTAVSNSEFPFPHKIRRGSILISELVSLLSKKIVAVKKLRERKGKKRMSDLNECARGTGTHRGRSLTMDMAVGRCMVCEGIQRLAAATIHSGGM